jgi:hypothetical protein
MNRSILRGRHGRIRAVVGLGLALSFALAAGSTAIAKSGGPGLAQVRQVTEKYHDINAAIADGYVLFYKCTEQPGVGTMGQHFVKPALVGDPAVDPMQPEVLVYEPKRNGGYKLVAVEYVTIAAAWQGAFGSAKPTVLGQDMLFRAAGNRYGLPDFYERHAWLWQGNPAGTFSDWNPNITCLGTGDNGG